MAGPPRVVVLTWTARVAPGLMTAAAWDALRGADRVRAADTAHPLAAAMAEAGVVVRAQEPDQVADAVRAGATIGWLAAEDGDVELVERWRAGGVAVEVVPAAGEADAVDEAVDGDIEVTGTAVLDLVLVMDKLRSPGGCAWDADQTHESLLTYLVEETYETVEAVETGDLDGLREELGDLLLQVVFHARIGEEHAERPWSIDDVARGITDKLVRRHPHVFGDQTGDHTASDLEVRWDELKAAEKGRTSATDGVPTGQPALSLAAKLHDRAARAGVAPEVAAPALEVRDDDELGALLLGIVVEARRAGLDPEAALRSAARRYAQQVRDLEAARES